MERHRHDSRSKCDMYDSIDFDAVTVTIIGLPGVMTFVAESLVRDGCTVRIIDNTTVMPGDLHNATLFVNEHIGKSKAECGKAALKPMNKAAIVKGFYEDVNAASTYLLTGLVINASFSESVATVCSENALHVTPNLSLCKTYKEGFPSKNMFIGTILQKAGVITTKIYTELQNV